MVLTIARIVILLFISTIMMLLAAHSTTAEARIKRTSFVYALVAGFLIASDGKLILGVIEAAIFLVMIAFSAISCLYAYAGIEIEQKKSADKELANEECTALVVVPLKKTEAEVTYETVNMMVNLAFAIFCACLAALMVIRPTLLFPFYGKNPVLFIISLFIIIVNFDIASASGTKSTRAAENMDSSDGEVIFFIVIVALVLYGTIQLFAFFAYDAADDKAREAATMNGVPRSYGKMLPIKELYGYADSLPRQLKYEDIPYNNDAWIQREIDPESIIGDEIYLIEDATHREYYCNLYSFSSLYKVKNDSSSEVIIHLLEEDDETMPYMDIYDSYYINPRGEEDIASTLYSIYIKKEQILTY
ncbi:hypothetical protein IJH10_01015 [Candidatus Saccharibacteria bacterium]|nr:hypothetical protein [Candidatus Saccharibacteria bacterium]